MLGNGGKFASWIAAIARNTAINLGIRDRRELRKRERWSVEVPQAAPHPEDPSDPEQGETIRRALEGLPASHRECLVLFYIEGKSGSEAAIALGISEAAFRVRLHRARAALREQLEHTLAGSLEQLRPSKKMASTVMGAILASSTAKAATVGAGSGLSGALAKVIPLAWVLPYLSWIAILPMPFMGWFYARYESRNFRDPKGLRARFLREGIALQMLWLIPMMASIWWLTPLLSALYGFHAVFFGVGIFSLIMTIAMGRRLKINQNRFFVLSVVSSGSPYNRVLRGRFSCASDFSFQCGDWGAHDINPLELRRTSQPHGLQPVFSGCRRNAAALPGKRDKGRDPL